LVEFGLSVATLLFQKDISYLFCMIHRKRCNFYGLGAFWTIVLLTTLSGNTENWHWRWWGEEDCFWLSCGCQTWYIRWRRGQFALCRLMRRNIMESVRPFWTWSGLLNSCLDYNTEFIKKKKSLGGLCIFVVACNGADTLPLSEPQK